MFLGLNKKSVVELLLQEWVEDSDQSSVHCLGPLGIPLLHQPAELVLVVTTVTHRIHCKSSSYLIISHAYRHAYRHASRYIHHTKAQKNTFLCLIPAAEFTYSHCVLEVRV